MRVRTSQSKLGLRFYIIKTYYDTKGIERTITVENSAAEQKSAKTGRAIRWNGQKNALLLPNRKKYKPRRFFHAFSCEINYTKTNTYLSRSDTCFCKKDFLRVGMDRICASIQKTRIFLSTLAISCKNFLLWRILDPDPKWYDFPRKLYSSRTQDLSF